MRSRLLVLLLLAGFALIASAVGARASSSGGGSNIASAPTITPGQQEFGNTNEGQFPFNCAPDAASYWKLTLIVGDRATIDWETTNNYAERLYVLPIGTTDFSISNVSKDVASFSIGGNGKAQSILTAPASGVYPLVFDKECIGGGGPYDFTVYINHALVLGTSQQTLRLLKRWHHSAMPRKGSLKLTAHRADGAPITGQVGATLYGYWAKKWHKLSRAAAKAGVLVLRYKLPKNAHGVIRLSVNAGGQDYIGKRIVWRNLRA